MTEKIERGELKKRLDIEIAGAQDLSEKDKLAGERLEITREELAERMAEIEKQARLTAQREDMIKRAKESEKRAGFLGTKGSK